MRTAGGSLSRWRFAPPWKEIRAGSTTITQTLKMRRRAARCKCGHQGMLLFSPSMRMLFSSLQNKHMWCWDVLGSIRCQEKTLPKESSAPVYLLDKCRLGRSSEKRPFLGAVNPAAQADLEPQESYKDFLKPDCVSTSLEWQMKGQTLMGGSLKW